MQYLETFQRDVGELLQDVFRAEQPNMARVLETMLFKEIR